MGKKLSKPIGWPNSVYVWKSKPRTSNFSKLPPGPPTVPILGNMHQIGAMPHRSLALLANQYGPLMHIKLGGLSTIVVSSPEMAKEVMKTHDTIFANRPYLLAADIITYGSKGMSFSPYGSYWRQMRKVCTFELLTPRRVGSFRPIREEEVSDLVKDIALSEGSLFNLSKRINSLAYGTTSRIAFGGKSKDQEAFIGVMKEVLKVVSGFSLADLYPSLGVLQVLTGLRSKAEKLHQEIDRILEKIVRDHRERSSEMEEASCDQNGIREDVVDVLLKLQKQDNLEHPLSDTIIKATILDIFSAGSGTSAKTIEWAMSELVKNPRVMEEAQAEVRRVYTTKGYVDEERIHELKYLKSVIKETLRLHPPVPLLLPRECSERCEIEGYEIEAKSKVIVNAWAIGRNPKYWDEAETFYPERFIGSSIDFKGSDFEFIPFGAGRRMCPGLAFGIAGVELPLANLLFHFDWKMPFGGKGEGLDMSESFGLTPLRNSSLHRMEPIPSSSSLAPWDGFEDLRSLMQLSISELITVLRNAFRPADFDHVEEALVAKETKLNAEIGALEERLDIERLDRMGVEEKFRMKNGMDDGVIAELKIRNRELEEEKRRAERAAESWKGKFEELNERVLRLESAEKLFMKGKTSVGAGRNTELEGRGGHEACVKVKEEKETNGVDVRGRESRNARESVNTHLSVGEGTRESPVTLNKDVLGASAAVNDREPPSLAGEMLKRKWVAGNSSIEVGNKVIMNMLDGCDSDDDTSISSLESEFEVHLPPNFLRNTNYKRRKT
ncbi:cytochrome P450 71D10 [Senna tora]|uniref:Cytochrome P450 71D10 n=1 Tax=Senna tora TaxID=362788 RepID=A0A834TZN2_9FABA|nr:cytochrome P450 71D10 [Senna tora]